MVRFHNINGNKVQFTEAEETARDEEERIWNEGKFDRVMVELREQRTKLLSETDFYALQDVSISEDMTTYRQALRDITNGLTTVEEVQAVTFPVKP